MSASKSDRCRDNQGRGGCIAVAVAVAVAHRVPELKCQHLNRAAPQSKAATGRKRLSFLCSFVVSSLQRRRGGIGRRAGLKIQYPQGCEGSSPFAGTPCRTVFYEGKLIRDCKEPISHRRARKRTDSHFICQPIVNRERAKLPRRVPRQSHALFRSPSQNLISDQSWRDANNSALRL